MICKTKESRVFCYAGYQFRKNKNKRITSYIRNCLFTTSWYACNLACVIKIMLKEEFRNCILSIFYFLLCLVFFLYSSPLYSLPFTFRFLTEPSKFLFVFYQIFSLLFLVLLNFLCNLLNLHFLLSLLCLIIKIIYVIEQFV